MLASLWNEPHGERSSRFLFLLPRHWEVSDTWELGTGNRGLVAGRPLSLSTAAVPRHSSSGGRASVLEALQALHLRPPLSYLASEQTPGCGSELGLGSRQQLSWERERWILSHLHAPAWVPTVALRTDAASFVHGRHSYGSGLWSKINGKKWVGH